MEAFLTDFGMVARRTTRALCMRDDTARRIHVTELGEPASWGSLVCRRSRGGPRRLGEAAGRRAGRGDRRARRRVMQLLRAQRLSIEVVHRRRARGARAVPRQAMNSGAEGLKRAGEVMRIARVRAMWKRIGHTVIGTPHSSIESVEIVRDALGLVCSDDLCREQGPRHRLLQPLQPRQGLRRSPRVLLHQAREDRAQPPLLRGAGRRRRLLQGHEHLRQTGEYEHMWSWAGICWGADIYDYWADPGAARVSIGPTPMGFRNRSTLLQQGLPVAMGRAAAGEDAQSDCCVSHRAASKKIQ